MFIAQCCLGNGAESLCGQRLLEAPSANLRHDRFHILMLFASTHGLPTTVVRMPVQTRGSEGRTETLRIDAIGIGHIDGGDQLAWNYHVSRNLEHR